MLHEALLALFRNRPSLAPEMLQEVFGVELPRYSEIRFDEADFTQLVPTEYRADLVVLLWGGKPVYGIVVEAQLAPDPDKHFKWPVYQTVLRSKLKCPACVMVVTPIEEVARWAAKPIDTGQ